MIHHHTTAIVMFIFLLAFGTLNTIPSLVRSLTWPQRNGSIRPASNQTSVASSLSSSDLPSPPSPSSHRLAHGEPERSNASHDCFAGPPERRRRIDYNKTISALRRHRLLLIGDSTMRYQYINLAHFLTTGLWSADTKKGRPGNENKNSYRDPAAFFQATQDRLKYEVCDCYRGKGGNRSRENRYYYNPAAEVSVVYVGQMGEHPVAITEPRLINASCDPMRGCVQRGCKAGYCNDGSQILSQDQKGEVWGNQICRLRPTIALANMGHWLTKRRNDNADDAWKFVMGEMERAEKIVKDCGIFSKSELDMVWWRMNPTRVVAQQLAENASFVEPRDLPDDLLLQRLAYHAAAKEEHSDHRPSWRLYNSHERYFRHYLSKESTSTAPRFNHRGMHSDPVHLRTRFVAEQNQDLLVFLLGCQILEEG